MSQVKRALAHIAPEELLLIPVVIIVILGVLLQPQAITRLFEEPYATPIPGDSPADVILQERRPSPAPSPALRGQLEVQRMADGALIVLPRHASPRP